MKLKATFRRKETAFDAENCEVSRVIELPQGQFDYFMTHLLDEQDFLVELREEMGYTEDGVRHCLLVLPEKGDDGYPCRCPRQLIRSIRILSAKCTAAGDPPRYQSLSDFAKEMYGHAESAVKRILQNQVDGNYYLKVSDLPDPIQNPMFDYQLLGQMLSERPEFASVETMSSEILVAVAPEYQIEGIDESKYRELTKDEVDIMLAKHMLFLRDAGGEQANFSGCLLKDMELPRAVFNNAVMTNAVFVDCNLSEADMNFASAHGAKFVRYDLSHMYGDEADFSYAQFTDCDMRQGLTMHANYTGTDF